MTGPLLTDEPVQAFHSQSLRQTWICWAAILLVVGIAFSPVCRNLFTNLDEPVLILNNPWVQELSWENLAAMFGSSLHYTYSPVAFLAFAMEKRAFGFNPEAFHAVTLFFHLASTLLVGLWIKDLTGDEKLGAGTALLFGLHPLQVESVAWVTGQRTVLFGFFFMAALFAFGRFEATRSRTWFAASFVALLLSLLTKGVAFVFPLVLILQRWYSTPSLSLKAGALVAGEPPAETLTAGSTAGRSQATRSQAIGSQAIGSQAIGSEAIGSEATRSQANGWDLLPFAILSIGFLVVSWLAAVAQMQEVPFLERILVAAHGILRYLRQTVFPFDLAFAYPYPEGDWMAFPWAFKAAPAMLLTFGWIIISRRDLWRSVAFGLGFFVLNILPVSQLVTVGMKITSSDHFMFVAIAGLAFALTVAFSGFPLLVSWKRARQLSLLLFLAFSAILGAVSFGQCKIWRDSKTLYSHALAIFPETRFPRHQLGVTFLEEESWKEAAEQFTLLLKRKPGDRDARMGRAAALIGAHSWREAGMDLDELLREEPTNSTAKELRDLVSKLGGD